MAAIPGGRGTPHQQLVTDFHRVYGCAAHAVATAPGRVNLIGEHIDYEGYGVMPIAISQACSVAIAWEPATKDSGDSTIHRSVAAAGHAEGHQQPLCTVMHISNTQQVLYPAGQLQLSGIGYLPDSCPGWFRYILAAYKGCVELVQSKQQQVPSKSDILLLVQSTVPPGAGLSSSSALVVSAALALLALWRIDASPAEVAEFTCSCERFVGTQGGGMDQAVAVMAEPGVAMHVEFAPVRAQAVVLPEGGVFVVAHCLAPSLKAETAASRFNLRVLECRLAAMLLAKRLQDSSHNTSSSSDQGSSNSTNSSSSLNWQQVKMLNEVESSLLNIAAAGSGLGTTDPTGHTAAEQCPRCTQVQGVASQILQAVKQFLPHTPCQLQQVAKLLGTSKEHMLGMLPPPLQVAAAADPLLYLQQRALHVFSEAQRVIQFKAVCKDAQLTDADKLVALGGLMDASHASCAGLYECSCEELDTLVGVAKKAGALGVRLTGAGWGGCVVALVATPSVAAFMQQVDQEYYQPLASSGRLQSQPLLKQQPMFVTVPAGGASVALL